MHIGKWKLKWPTDEFCRFKIICRPVVLPLCLIKLQMEIAATEVVARKKVEGYQYNPEWNINSDSAECKDFIFLLQTATMLIRRNGLSHVQLTERFEVEFTGLELGRMIFKKLCVECFIWCVLSYCLNSMAIFNIIVCPVQLICLVQGKWTFGKDKVFF